jgi:hypothetical protein
MESAANLLPFIRAPDPLPAPKEVVRDLIEYAYRDFIRQRQRRHACKVRYPSHTSLVEQVASGVRPEASGGALAGAVSERLCDCPPLQ